MRPAVHLVVNSIAIRRGGLVMAVMRRANALAESGMYDVVINVLGAQPWLEIDVETLRREGHLHEDVTVRRVLSTLDTSKGSAPYELPQGHVTEVSANRSYIIEDGVAVARIQTAGPLIRWVEPLTPAGDSIRRDELAPDGTLFRRISAGDEPGSAVHEWIGRDGGVLMRVNVEASTGNWLRPWVRGFGQLDEMGDAYKPALDRTLAPWDEVLFFSEFRENLPNLPESNLDEITQALNHRNIHRVAVAHSNHLSSPYRPGAGVSPNWSRLLTNLNRWDGLWVWTPEQAADIRDEFGVSGSIETMPPYAPPVYAPEQEQIDPDRFVLVARIHPKKGVGDAIRAFARVRERLPATRLHAYGFGYGDAESAKVEALIDQLGVRDWVITEQFTGDRTQIYAGACATLLTSRSEGLGQVILESMAYGVPVVSFDTCYGPRLSIRDGQNGYLVAQGDTSLMADRLISLSTDPALRARLGEAARATAGESSPETFAARWVDLVNRQLAKPPVLRPYAVSAIESSFGDTVRVTGHLPSHVVVRSMGSTLVKETSAGALELELKPKETAILRGLALLGGKLTDGDFLARRNAWGYVTVAREG